MDNEEMVVIVTVVIVTVVTITTVTIGMENLQSHGLFESFAVIVPNAID
ncbi:hypothetical protein GCM10027566_02250 [Arachidicoccus ginsenosidivorans]